MALAASNRLFRRSHVSESFKVEIAIGGIMKIDKCTELFMRSIVALIVCLATSVLQVNAAFAADADHKVRRPHIVGGTYEFSDYPGMDEGSDYGMRAFTITDASVELHAAYKSNFTMHGAFNLSSAIFSFHDRLDGFFDAYVQDLGASKHWQSVQAHVGTFVPGDADCGENLDVVYTLSNSTVVAEFQDSIPIDMECRKSDYEASDPRPAPTFCAMLGKCLTKYFRDPTNIAKLQSPSLKKVRQLRLK